MSTQTVAGTQPAVLPAPRTAEAASPVATASSTVRLPGAPARAALTRLLRAPALAFLELLLLAGLATALRLPVPEAAGLTAGTLVLLAAGRHYRDRLAPSVLDQVPGLVGRSLAAGAAVVAVDLVVGRPAQVQILQAAAAFAALALIGRSVAYAVVTRLRRCGVLARRTLVVGDGDLAGRLVDVLMSHTRYGLRPVGVVDDNPWPERSSHVVPHLPGSALDSLLDEHDVQTVVVAFGSAQEPSTVQALRACGRHPCEVYVVPRLYELRGAAAGADVETVWGIPLVRLPRAPFRSGSWRVKRAVDIVAAGAASLLLAPVLLLCALLVRIESGPGVLFRQERVGLDGRPFVLLKFRSLRPSSEDESSRLWNVAHDQRVGPVGRLLRRTSLDELPQLWNILRGDMSLVGPRPERPHFVTEFAGQFPHYSARHRVPVGLTGLAQVVGLRGDTSISDRAWFDNYYIENWSLWLDIKIMLMTVGQVVRCAGR